MARRKHGTFIHALDRRAAHKRSLTYLVRDYAVGPTVTPTAEEARWLGAPEWSDAVERPATRAQLRPFTVYLKVPGDEWVEEVAIAATDHDAAGAIANDLIRIGHFESAARVARVVI